MPNSTALLSQSISPQVHLFSAMVLLLGAAPTNLLAQSRAEFVVSRPNEAEAAEVAGPGMVILESGATVLFDGSFRTIDLPEFQLRAGVAPRLELRLSAPIYSYLSGDGRSSSSVGEGSIEAKWLVKTTGALRLGLPCASRSPRCTRARGRSTAPAASDAATKLFRQALPNVLATNSRATWEWRKAMNQFARSSESRLTHKISESSRPFLTGLAIRS